MEHIELKGVKTNNLKSIDVDFPLGCFSVVTGVSGSGKSSLVFDTLYGESYRRYVESLSSFARQYLKALPKPELNSVKNLPPAIAVRQSRSGANSRSTVGTMTELLDLIRIIFTNLAQIRCSGCGKRIVKATPDRMVAALTEVSANKRVMVAAPLSQWQGLKPKELQREVLAQGFSRAWFQGEAISIEDLSPKQLLDSLVIIDRCRVEKDNSARLASASATALRLGRGHAVIISGEEKFHFLDQLHCYECDLSYSPPSSALLSFNHPMGACEVCQGFGYEGVVDWDKVFPDLSQSLASEGVVPWNFGSHSEVYQSARSSARKHKIPVAKPFGEYSSEQWRWLKDGSDKDSFKGVNGYFDWLNSKKHKAHYRIHSARFRKYVICGSCHGFRLNRQALALYVDDKNIGEVCQLSIRQLVTWLDSLSPEAFDPTESYSSEGIGVAEALEEAQARVDYLISVGLGYLTIDRQTRTLSGGELQRIHMARCLGSALTETLYCLDEPTSGLHPRDSARLLSVIEKLRDQGNSVVVVEHERHIISAADHLIEIGPQAGHLGGKLVYHGKPRRGDKVGSRSKSKTSLPARTSFIKLRAAATHNLRSIDTQFPVGAMTVVCGVSGSGKTSLIQHTFYPMLAKALGQSKIDGYVAEPSAKSIGPKSVLSKIEQVIHVSQTTIGRSSRSNIATYLGIFDEVRRRFAAEPAARALGLTPRDFSFNTSGGRCETCQGLGSVIEDLSFLGEMAVKCPVCDGRRFQERILEIHHRGLDLNQVLALTVTQSREMFFDSPVVIQQLDAVEAMGLGYITLGQQTSSFSGGEAQRLKLLRLLKDAAGKKPSVLIFDEPTTGLSDWDVQNLISQLRILTAKGHTVVVVEHHLDVMSAADWLIEIGPEAADEGGQLVYEGPPGGLMDVEASVTSKYLQNIEA